MADCLKKKREERPLFPQVRLRVVQLINTLSAMGGGTGIRLVTGASLKRVTVFLAHLSSPEDPELQYYLNLPLLRLAEVSTGCWSRLQTLSAPFHVAH